MTEEQPPVAINFKNIISSFFVSHRNTRLTFLYALEKKTSRLVLIACNLLVSLSTLKHRIEYKLETLISTYICIYFCSLVI